MLKALELFALGILPVFLVLDLIVRARRFKAAKGWRFNALIVTVAIFYLSLIAGQLWGEVFNGWSLIDGSALGVVGGALAGILVYELVHYWYHRAAHRFDWLWRLGHQMHHSAESVDAFGAYYLHPIDAFLFSTWSSLVMGPLLGLSPESGAIAAAFLAFNAAFQHANIKTPHWLGYLIQRPESHTIHHGRGVHAHNYSDLPLWDMVFGTFRNPKSIEGMQAGFYQGASRRLIDMLVFKDVSQPGPR